MLFPTHLLVGYVLGRRWGLSALPAVAGAALPDVVDKTLATAGVFGLYHTIGHSLLALAAAAVAFLGGSALARRNDRTRQDGRLGRIAAAFWVGWASHLALDAVHMAVNGRPADVRFLAWPFVHHVPAVQLPPVEFAFHYLWTPSFFLEVAIWIGVGLALLTGRGLGAR